ncbi:Zinc finger, C3HC4 type (RING finger)/Helicase conserved C-terminal domain containing protein, putative [Angomonas deanei]|uniref:Zinc finger, C3HC4 type (RING finger)/Helicase conserved C-terminal domain containing protein, putative n=1 Tax=Angomonas deanei TaxID=59799 RepID=A0A7G2C218_9TRYP|nr:Zinc finger, C3HC4 type (RING finger)/Helicase conserved C-terminal domain containing protein, putative [Angomonas deanei]
MHLADPIHESCEAPLSADEMHYYDILATFIYNSASLLSRQGLLASRATAVLQWIQDLSCTCIHPTLRERIFRAVTADGGVEFAERLRDHYGNNTSAFVADTNQSIDVLKTFLTVTAEELLSWLGEMRDVKKMRVPEDTLKSAHDLHAKPPQLPVCTICLDTASEPTYLCCLHYFCKECCLEVINNSVSYTGNITAKCPMCRDKESMLVEKRVVQLEEDAEELEITHSLSAQVQSRVMDDEAYSNNAEELTYEQRIRRIGAGSRVKKVMEVLHTIWSGAPTDKVIIFSKYPQALHLVQDAVRQLAAQQADNDFDLFLIDGSVTLSKRRNILTQLGSPHRRGVLLLTSRAACAGLNLIFANHVLFLEPNMNPAMEIQAIGRVHRFGQQKQVKVYHLYSPHTIDQLVYARSTRLLNRIQEDAQHREANRMVINDNQDNAFEVNVRHAQLGRLEQDDMLTLLTYPVPRG